MKSKYKWLLLSLIFFVRGCWPVPAFSTTAVINSFNAGELSPLLRGRSDVKKYYSGCQTLENMVVLPHGGVTKRPGTYYIASAKTASDVCRLVSFEYSTIQAYILEFGDEYMRFYKDGGQILSRGGSEDLSALNNIVAHWLLNEYDASTLVADDDGGTHDGTATSDTGSLSATGKVGLCFDFDNADAVEVTDHTDFTFDDSGTSPFSIVSWVYVADSDAMQVIASKWKEDTAREWRLSLSENRKLQMHLCDDSVAITGDRVAHWYLNDNASSTLVDDVSTNHDGVASSNTDTFNATGWIGGALDFGAAESAVVSDAAALSFDDSGANPFSISAWIFVTVTSNYQTILAKWDDSGTEDREWSMHIDGRQRFEFSSYDESNNANSRRFTNASLAPGWHHVVGTYDSTGGASAHTGRTLYIDGSAIADGDTVSQTKTGYTNMVAGGEDVIIGARRDGASVENIFADKLDNVILFSVELTATQVSNLYNNGFGTEGLAATYASTATDDALSLGWHLVASTYVGTGGATAADDIILYVDGAAVDVTATNEASYAAMENTATKVRIGSQYSAASANEKYWRDKIDNVSIFSDVLTPAEVLALYSYTAAYEISTPYAVADLPTLKYIQSADTMYLAHPDYAPRKLTRSAHDIWTLTEITFSRGPFLDENITSTTLTPSGTTGDVTVTASAALFNANHVGALWQISHIAAAGEVSGDFTATGNSSTTTVQNGRKYDLTTHGIWDGTILLQRSYDSGSTYEDIVAFNSKNDGNISFSESEDVDAALYRVRMNTYSTGTCSYSFVSRSFQVDGVVKVTNYSSPTVVGATVKEDLNATTATTFWSEGAWSPDEGYPSCLAFYEERQAYAGTTNSPQTIWFSQTDDWDNFLIGADDTDAISLTIAADQVNTIQWMMPQSALLIGTVGSEWKLSATTTEEPLTPSNVSAKRQSSLGSADVQPITTSDVLLYVQRQGQKVRKFQYVWERDAWVAIDLSLLSEHITGTGITQIALQRNPYPILWCVREDGALIGLTLEETNEIIGWHRHELGGDVESVAVIPGTDEDELWVSVELVVDSNTVRYVEQFQPFDWGTDQADCFFVDAGLSYDGGSVVTVTNVTQADPAVVTSAAHGLSDGAQVRFASVSGMTELNNNVYSVGTVATNTFELRDATDAVDINSVDFTAYTADGTATPVENTFTTLGHLEGESLVISGDGGYFDTATVSSGTITLDDYFNTVHAGKSFTSKVQPMQLELSSTPGALFGVPQRITELTLRLYKTLDCGAGNSWSNLDAYIFRDADNPLEAATPVFTGDKVIDFAGDYERSGNIYIQSSLPLPFTISSLVAEFEVYP